MKKLLFLFLLSGCIKDRCRPSTIVETELKLSNQVHLGYINLQLYTDERYCGSESFQKEQDSTYLLTWDVTPLIENEPRGKRLYVKTRLFDWRDGSYYYIPVDTIYKQ